MQSTRRTGWRILLMAVSLVASSTATSSATPPLAFVLLANNRLLAVRPAAGMIVAARQLAAVPGGTSFRLSGHFLAFSHDDQTLYALAPGGPDQPDILAVVAVAGLRLRARYTLPRDVTFSGMAIGPRTGRLYLFGPPLHALGAVVIVLDPHTGHLLARWPVHQDTLGDWVVYQGAVSPDERTLYLSYHGSHTTGIDHFTVTRAGLRPCHALRPPGVGCLATHGGFALYDGGLLATTGEGPIEQIDAAGRVVRRFDPHLPGNHLMEFALEARTGQIYIVGPYGYTGGMSVIALAAGRTHVVVPPAAPGQLITPTTGQVALCGERFALGPDHLLVVGKTAVTVPRLGIPGALLIVDTRTGAIRRKVITPSEPVDVVVSDSGQA